MKIHLDSFLDILTKEAPETINFNMNSFNCEFERVHDLHFLDLRRYIELEGKSQREIEKKVILRFVGWPICFEVVYCHDLNNSNYNKLEIHSSNPNRILSTINLENDLCQEEGEIILSPNIKFTFRDDFNNIRKDIALRLFVEETLINPIKEIKSQFHIGTYQTGLMSWINGKNTKEFLIDWIKVAIIMGYIGRKVDVIFFNVHELIEELDYKREELRLK